MFISLVVDGVDSRQLALCELQAVLLPVNENDLLGPAGLGAVRSQDPNCTKRERGQVCVCAF